MDGPGDYYIKWSKLEKDKYIYHFYKESKNMTQMNLSSKQKQTHRYKEQTCGCQGGGGVEEGVSN